METFNERPVVSDSECERGSLLGVVGQSFLVPGPGVPSRESVDEVVWLGAPS